MSEVMIAIKRKTADTLTSCLEYHVMSENETPPTEQEGWIFHCQPATRIMYLDGYLC